MTEIPSNRKRGSRNPQTITLEEIVFVRSGFADEILLPPVICIDLGGQVELVEVMCRLKGYPTWRVPGRLFVFPFGDWERDFDFRTGCGND